MKTLITVLLLLPVLAFADVANLTWTDNSGNEDGFRIERNLNGGAFAIIDSVGPNVSTYIDNGLVASLTVDNVYCYRVDSFNAAGQSNYSNTACKTIPKVVPVTPPNAPSGLTVSSLSPSQIQLSWAANSDNEDYFEAERRRRNPPEVATIIIAAGSTDYTDAGLMRNKAYTYKLRAVRDGVASTWSNESSATTQRR